MLRVALLLTVLVAAIGCGAGAGATAATAATELKISYWAEGPAAGNVKRWTLRCGPAGGTLPRPGAACEKLAALRSPFAPVPRDAMCTQQYGGPQEAVVQGTYRGRTVWTRLTMRDGCQIARFKRLAFLVPTFSARASS